jgi:peptide deformylase
MKQIIHEPHAVLHWRAEEVPAEEIPSGNIQQILKEMQGALSKTSEGIGIAAPQLGYSLRIFVASEEALRWEEARTMPEEERKKKKWEYYVFINPVIKKTSSKKIHELEGCLSIPKTYGIVERAEKVTVEAYNEKGGFFTRGTSRLYARLMQHEIDHLNGVLFIEKARDIRRIVPEPKKHGTHAA